MIFESYPWKQDLLRRKRLFIKYNTVERFEKNNDTTYTVLEKAVFYSAFIIRKLIDCHTKLSDEADSYTLPIAKHLPKKQVTLWERWADEDTHDWENYNQETALGKNVCNWLIHSFVFAFCFNDDGIVDGFFVSSDYDRNKALYYIAIKDWLNYIDFIARDDIAGFESHYDPKLGDYVFTKKIRGKVL